MPGRFCIPCARRTVKEFFSLDPSQYRGQRRIAGLQEKAGPNRGGERFHAYPVPCQNREFPGCSSSSSFSSSSSSSFSSSKSTRTRTRSGTHQQGLWATNRIGMKGLSPAYNIQKHAELPQAQAAGGKPTGRVLQFFAHFLAGLFWFHIRGNVEKADRELSGKMILRV